jgi:lipoprotein-anchoring transpeptidase ErfK/SrfK
MVRRLIVALGVAFMLAMLRTTVHAAPPEDPDVYVVRPGDTLSSIAVRSGTTVAALVKANGIRNQNIVYNGQRLVLPGKSAAPAPALAGAPKAAATGVSAPRAPDSLSVVTAGPLPAGAPTVGKWIDVNLSKQRLTAYEGNVAVYSTAVSTGKPATPTVVGKFAVRTKIRAQAMSGPGYYLPNVPHVMYFIGGYAIHGAYWHNNFGRTMSHGCVNLPLGAAAWVYNWASVGTPVIVHR